MNYTYDYDADDDPSWKVICDRWEIELLYVVLCKIETEFSKIL